MLSASNDFTTFHTYICIIYTSNLGLRIAFLGREREQSCFEGSIKGAPKEQEGAAKSMREHYEIVQRRGRWEPESNARVISHNIR